jgi:hypothetical protein
MAHPNRYGSYPPTSPIPTAFSSRPQRVWAALLTLFFHDPIVPEMLTGSTPPLMFINPISLLFETGLYGTGAILIRELVRRHGLGWTSIRICYSSCRKKHCRYDDCEPGFSGGINHTRTLSCTTRKAQCKHCSIEAYYVILGIE